MTTLILTLAVYTFITFVGASVGAFIGNVGELKLVTILLVSILWIALVAALKIRHCSCRISILEQHTMLDKNSLSFMYKIS